MGRPWTDDELSFIQDFPSDWEGFHAAFPERSYDSWEVKRRRVNGSAGRSRSYGKREADKLAEEVLRVLEAYMERRRA